MFKDYTGSFIEVKGRNRLKTAKNRKSAVASRLHFQVSGIMRKTIGAMLLLTLLLGISSTLWFGLQVRVALDEIGSYSARNRQLRNNKELLVVQRDLMLTRKHIEKEAQKLGLRPPAKNQLRYP